MKISFISLNMTDGYSALFAVDKISCIKAEVEDTQKTLVYVQGDDSPFHVRDSIKEINQKLQQFSIDVEII